jgi:hypothetical protein
MKTTRIGHVGVEVKENVGPYLRTHQSTSHMSPLIFDLAVDALAIYTGRSKIE